MRNFLTKDNMTVKISLLLKNSAPFSITAFVILYDILRLGKLKYNLKKIFTMSLLIHFISVFMLRLNLRTFWYGAPTLLRWRTWGIESSTNQRLFRESKSNFCLNTGSDLKYYIYLGSYRDIWSQNHLIWGSKSIAHI